MSQATVGSAGAADATPISYQCTYTIAPVTEDFTLTGIVEPGPVAPGGEIHIDDLTFTHDIVAGEYIWITLNGTEIELGRTAGDPPDGGFPHSTTPIDVTIPAPSATGPYEIEPTSMRFAPFGYPPDNPEQFTVTCNVTTSGGPLGTVDIEEPTTTTSSTTTTSTTSTVPPTVPPTTLPADVTTIDGVGVTSQGCDVSVPVHFAEAGDYTLTARTATGRDIGSTDVTRDAPGDQTVVVTIDGNHGLHHGDEVDLVLTDSSGATVAQTTGEVDDPNACTPQTPTTTAPGKGTTKPLVKSNTAPPATPTSAKPAYTG